MYVWSYRVDEVRRLGLDHDQSPSGHVGRPRRACRGPRRWPDCGARPRRSCRRHREAARVGVVPGGVLDVGQVHPLHDDPVLAQPRECAGGRSPSRAAGQAVDSGAGVALGSGVGYGRVAPFLAELLVQHVLMGADDGRLAPDLVRREEQQDEAKGDHELADGADRGQGPVADRAGATRRCVRGNVRPPGVRQRVVGHVRRPVAGAAGDPGGGLAWRGPLGPGEPPAGAVACRAGAGAKGRQELRVVGMWGGPGWPMAERPAAPACRRH